MCGRGGRYIEACVLGSGDPRSESWAEATGATGVRGTDNIQRHSSKAADFAKAFARMSPLRHAGKSFPARIADIVTRFSPSLAALEISDTSHEISARIVRRPHSVTLARAQC